MKFQHAAAILFTVAVANAQDTLVLTDGKRIEDARIQSFDIRELKYQKGGSSQTVASDKVDSIELGKFADTYRRGLAARDPDLMVTTVRDQVTQKNKLMAQLGYVAAARMFFQNGDAPKAAAALDELEKSVPEAGVLPEVYRLKFHHYMSLGDKGALQNAGIVAKKMQNEAVTNAWPNGFAIEGELYSAMVENAQGGDARAFQTKMREIVGKSLGNYPNLVNTANIALANSLRLNKDTAGAAKLYQEIVAKDSADDGARGGAYLGLGLMRMAEGDAANRDPFRDALMMFLRVRLETKKAGPGLQAEALYNAMLAAEKWGGEEWRLIASRCKWYLINEYAGTEWADRARSR